jgi:hypothetical protein
MSNDSINMATTTLSPEALIEQFRAIRAQIGEITPLTPAQRSALRKTKVTDDVLHASINVIDGTDLIAQAVGQQAAELRDLQAEANQWTRVEDELRTLLNGVAGANLIRRQHIALVSGRAYGIGAQLARDPAHAVLVPQVQEIKRLKRLARRKKPQKSGNPPAPATPAPGADTDPSKNQKP